MSDRAPYSRVYHAIIDDPKFAAIYDDDRRLATWLRLLIVAEQAHPASANIPTGTHRGSVTALAEAGLLDLGTGSRYRIHGLDAERERRAEIGRIGGLASGRSRSVERSLNGSSGSPGTKSNEHRRAETSKAEQVSAPDPWDDPEHEAIAWLAKHGCALQPHSGYYRNLVTMIETHGVNAVVGMLDRLAGAGTKDGDVKGFVFGAKDALDARTRPSLSTIAKEERSDDHERSKQRRLEATQRYLDEFRGEAS